MNQERKEFEEWLNLQPRKASTETFLDGGYKSQAVQVLWECWQTASRARQAKTEPVAWHPIETAPKHGHVRVAWNPRDWTTGDAYRRDGRWFAAACFVFGYKEIEVEPIYWQPYPDAPQEPKA